MTIGRQRLRLRHYGIILFLLGNLAEQEVLAADTPYCNRSKGNYTRCYRTEKLRVSRPAHHNFQRKASICLEIKAFLLLFTAYIFFHNLEFAFIS